MGGPAPAAAAEASYGSSRTRSPHHPQLKGQRIIAIIPTEAGEAPDSAFDRASYRERNIVERMINCLMQWRCVATRYEKWAANYAAMVTLGCILIWL